MSSSESDCHPNQSDGTGAGLLELRCYKKVLKKAFMKANVLLLRSLKPLDTWTRGGNLHDSTRWEMIKRAAALNEFILEEMRKTEKYNMPTDPATQTAELLTDVDTFESALERMWCTEARGRNCESAAADNEPCIVDEMDEAQGEQCASDVANWMRRTHNRGMARMMVLPSFCCVDVVYMLRGFQLFFCVGAAYTKQACI